MFQLVFIPFKKKIKNYYISDLSELDMIILFDKNQEKTAIHENK